MKNTTFTTTADAVRSAKDEAIAAYETHRGVMLNYAYCNHLRSRGDWSTHTFNGHCDCGATPGVTMKLFHRGAVYSGSALICEACGEGGRK